MKCPICAKQSNAQYRPFCSRRCADLDLGNWLNGSYAVPDEPFEDTEIPPEISDTDTPRTH